MWRFLAGVLIGALLAIGYVRFNLELPRILQLPDALRGGFISSATEEELYALSGDNEKRLRALEIYFANRASDAAALDALAGHPFLQALHQARARREAHQLMTRWSGFDKVLDQPALRQALERKYGLTDAEELKLRMLLDELGQTPFLKGWLGLSGPVTADNIRQRIEVAAESP